MPIDTDVDVRMKCYGKKDGQDEWFCEWACCFIEQDLCAMQTDDNHGVVRPPLNLKEFDDFVSESPPTLPPSIDPTTSFPAVDAKLFFSSEPEKLCAVLEELKKPEKS